MNNHRLRPVIEPAIEIGDGAIDRQALAAEIDVVEQRDPACAASSASSTTRPADLAHGGDPIVETHRAQRRVVAAIEVHATAAKERVRAQLPRTVADDDR